MGLQIIRSKGRIGIKAAEAMACVYEWSRWCRAITQPRYCIIRIKKSLSAGRRHKVTLLEIKTEPNDGYWARRWSGCSHSTSLWRCSRNLWRKVPIQIRPTTLGSAHQVTRFETYKPAVIKSWALLLCMRKASYVIITRPLPGLMRQQNTISGFRGACYRLRFWYPDLAGKEFLRTLITGLTSFPRDVAGAIDRRALWAVFNQQECDMDP